MLLHLNNTNWPAGEEYPQNRSLWNDHERKTSYQDQTLRIFATRSSFVVVLTVFALPFSAPHPSVPPLLCCSSLLPPRCWLRLTGLFLPALWRQAHVGVLPAVQAAAQKSHGPPSHQHGELRAWRGSSGSDRLVSGFMRLLA